MTSRSRSLPWPVAAALATVLMASRTRAQDAPLYRDPSPLEGPRIEGPLLPPRPNSPPPPPSSLGPFQPANSGSSTASEPVREPLLIVQPIPPPLPAMPVPVVPLPGDVHVRRKTTIRTPDGAFARCHKWFHEALFGPPKPATWVVVTADRDFFSSLLHPIPEAGAPARPINWPVWPLSGDR
jgi:hypothetical protein